VKAQPDALTRVLVRRLRRFEDGSIMYPTGKVRDAETGKIRDPIKPRRNRLRNYPR
jgi:hypothetical protein